MGTLLVNIESSNGSTTELLYICKGVSGMYLPQTALKRLNILNNSFPEEPLPAVNAAIFW